VRTRLKRFEEAFEGVSRVKSFGRSGSFLVEVDQERMLEAAAWLRMEETFRMDFLENLSLHESKDRLVLTAFIRSIPTSKQLIFRTSVPMGDDGAWAELPSLRGIWPQAEPFESENSPLFGVRFVGGSKDPAVRREYGDFGGFPMRKSFDWGQEAEP
jgi:NADH:ubiquinone oxidoreductase subunit C